MSLLISRQHYRAHAISARVRAMCHPRLGPVTIYNAHVTKFRPPKEDG